MSPKIEYSVTRVPWNDWDNIMETVSLDGSYSEEIENEVWTAIENMEDFSNPWVVVAIHEGPIIAKIFNKEEAARKYVKSIKKRLPKTSQVLCLKAEYKSNLKPVIKPMINDGKNTMAEVKWKGKILRPLK